MIEMILKTEDSWGPLALRITLGSVVLAHGLQKLFGWFGGYGYTGTMEFFTGSLGIPWIAGFLVILLESVGALALILGVATRLLAVCYLFLAIGIIAMVHIQNGFFMNWAGNQAGEGIEFFLLWIGMAVALIITGGGKFSVDEKFLDQKVRNQANTDLPLA